MCADTATISATVIFLHGLGDSGAGWRPVAGMLAERFQHVKFVLPNAPSMSVSLFQGMYAPSWFDIRSISMEKPDEDEAGIIVAAKSIQLIIKAEVDAGLPANRIVLGGFSQGAATSLFTGLTSEKRLAGIIALSGWVPLSTKIKNLLSPVAKEIPFFFGHGTDDTVVPHNFGMESSKLLVKNLDFPTRALDGSGPGVVFQSYQGMEHSSDPREIRDLIQWIGGVIP